jgi:hypothetical protein
VNAEFNVWLLIVGLVIGAGLVWLVIIDSRRRESEIDAVERPREAAWLSAVLAEDGYEVSADAAERLLVLHRAYLDAPPPDEVVAPGQVVVVVAPYEVVAADPVVAVDDEVSDGGPGAGPGDANAGDANGGGGIA